MPTGRAPAATWKGARSASASTWSTSSTTRRCTWSTSALSRRRPQAEPPPLRTGSLLLGLWAEGQPDEAVGELRGRLGAGPGPQVRRQLRHVEPHDARLAGERRQQVA